MFDGAQAAIQPDLIFCKPRAATDRGSAVEPVVGNAAQRARIATERDTKP